MSRKRRVTSPRKVPLQKRSQVTVNAITQAATYILVKHGWDRLTTNAIAERAGVNISSLYQYFPNKEAIVAELQRRHIAETRQKLRMTVPLLPAQRSLREALTLLVQAMIDEHRIAPAVHRAIAEELPGSIRHAMGEDPVGDQILEALRPFMKNVPDPHLAIRIAHTAAHAIIHETASHQPELFDRPDFIEEVVALFERYLNRPVQATSTRTK